MRIVIFAFTETIDSALSPSNIVNFITLAGLAKHLDFLMAHTYFYFNTNGGHYYMATVIQNGYNKIVANYLFYSVISINNDCS